MQFWFKLIWLGSTILGGVSLIWFVLGVTANLQRQLDLVETVKMIYFAVPSFILIILSIWLFFAGWNPSSKISYVLFFSGIIVLITLSFSLLKSTSTEGWLTERVRSDSLKISSDQKYEYRIELINVFQRNSYSRLRLTRIATGEEIDISVDIRTDRIRGLGIKEVNNWVTVEPTDTPEIYIMYTTRELGIPIEKFNLDIKTRTSERLK